MLDFRKHRKRSTQSGVTMVECLVAMILGSLYCLALLDIFAQSLRVTTTNTNSQAAHLIAETVLDAFKSSPYSLIANSVGTYNLSPGQAPLFHPMPTWLDFNDYTWSKTLVGFPGTVTLQIQQGPDANSYTGIVTVGWSDGNEIGKSYQTLALVEQNGLNAYSASNYPLFQ